MSTPTVTPTPAEQAWIDTPVPTLPGTPRNAGALGILAAHRSGLLEHFEDFALAGERLA